MEKEGAMKANLILMAAGIAAAYMVAGASPVFSGETLRLNLNVEPISKEAARAGSLPVSCRVFDAEAAGGKINVDMLRAVRLIESVTGEKLVYMEGDFATRAGPEHSYGHEERITELEIANRELRIENQRLRKEILAIKLLLGMR